MLTPDDVRNAAFSSPPLGKRGYNQEQVDEFLDLLESTLRGTGGQVTAAQVRAVTFGKPPIGKRGYNEDEVDQFLDRAAAHLDGGAVADPMRAEARSNVAPPGMVAPKRRWWQR